MSMKPENRFRLSVHKFLPTNLHHEKMNNPFSSGTADDWYSGNKADLWVEFKFLPTVPQRAIIWLTDPDVKKPLMSKLQELWLRGRYEEGRNISVVIGCPDGGVILQNLEWERQISAKKFRDELVPRKDIALWITEATMRK